MSKMDVVMPQMGESITTGTITKWHKKIGDTIEVDENLLDISTDKVESEIPSPFAGKVVKLLYDEGETIDVGKVIAVIDDDMDAAIDDNQEKESSSVSSSKEEKDIEPPSSQKVAQSNEKQQSSERRFFTPLVRKMAKEAGIELSELEKLDGSGSAGRVNKADLEKFIEQKSQQSKSTPAKTPVFSSTDRVEIIQMDNMRKAIAKNMTESKLTSPHVNSIGEVDMSHLVKFRESFKDEFFKQEGFKLTYTPFIMRALVMALKDYPMVNASIDGDNIVLKKDINLGCAVAVAGNGLVVPVIKQADNYNMLGLCRAINELAHKARAKKLSMDELSGGTFTFTNVGSFGTIMATPVILQPQVGIFAAGVIQKRVVVMKDDSIAVRSMMYGTHTYDHRLVDGELGGLFLNAVIKHLHEMKPQDLF